MFWFDSYPRILLVFAVISCGCVSTSSTEKTISDLPQARMSLDSVGLEIGFIRWPITNEQQHDQLWNDIDETPLSPDLRMRLDPNGIRCGLVGVQLPEIVRQLLDDKTSHDAISGEELGEAKKNRVIRWRRLHSRADQRGEIVTSDTIEKLNLLVSQHGEVIGRTYRNAQCFFSIRSQPLGDGRARIVLVPEIHHGTPQRNWAGDTGTWRFDVSRNRKKFEELRMEVVLSPGESMAVGCTQTIRGLGQQFFVGSDENDRKSQKLLMIRLAQTQQDNLFQSTELAESGKVATH